MKIQQDDRQDRTKLDDTTTNISQKSLETFMLINCSNRIMWPVLLTGSHSVIPWTTPKKAAFKNSKNIGISFINSFG